MREYRMKSPERVERAVTGAYHRIEDAVVGAYKKVETGAVGGYKKIEAAFTDAFLERVDPPAREATEDDRVS